MSSPLVLITGSSDGIGKETACQLAERGARVILHGRDPERLAAAAREVDRRSGTWPAGEEVADLASLAAVRALAERLVDQYPRLDVLINNAGVFMRDRVLTADGLETTFAVNHLAHVLLTHLLLPALRESPQGRVLHVSSGAHMSGRLESRGAKAGIARRSPSQGPEVDWDNLQGEQRYDGHEAYALSKLANVLFTVELARRLRGTSITANALHPGVVGTKLLRAGFGGHGPDSLAEGAATSVHLALAPELAGTSGGYFARSRPTRAHPLAGERAVTARFYELSCRLAQVTPLPPP
jgi:NAD(P)-dependent dehydrogenase (short-subunit alcohol dehydrogenase family)